MIEDKTMSLDKFYNWVKQSNNIVFFGGAGVSTVL